MKGLLAVLLACVGMVLMTCAGSAWAQMHDYVCYDQTQNCGTYGGQCYPYMEHAECADGVSDVYSIKASSLILGACTPSYLTCYPTTLSCYFDYYKSSNCSGGHCRTVIVSHSGCQ